jgi:predicted transcriptional regulator
MTMYEMITGHTSRQRSNIAISIVKILREYNESLQIDFLANILGRKKNEVIIEIETLEQLGVVKREADKVTLK